MGVLISDEQQSILVDGLHDFYGNAYEYPTKDVVNMLIANDEENFLEIVGNLNTHQHGDHFHETLTSQFLKNNPEVMFIGSDQTCSQIEHQAKGCLGKEDRSTFSIGDVEVEGFYMDHANPARLSAIQNIGFLIKINDRTILHVGDSYFNQDLFERLNLSSQKIDLVILPSWMASSDKVRDWINPKNILVTHVDPKRKNEIVTSVNRIYPNANFCTFMGEKFDY